MMTRSFSACTYLLAALSLLAAGCGASTETSAQREPTAEKSAPAAPEETLATAPALPDVNRMTPTELNRRLLEKNPGYAGDGVIESEEGVITIVGLRGKAIRDISPLTGLPLKIVEFLECDVRDLAPLQGMPLQMLHLLKTRVSDLSPLRGMPLKTLDVTQTSVRDLSPLAGMPLQELYLEDTQVGDLAPLEGMPLRILWLNNTQVTDLSPLRGMPLEQLNLVGTQVRDLSVVATLPLQTLWLRGAPADEFTPLQGSYLQSLDVQDTAFDNDDLKSLATLPMLRLNIAGTKVTDVRPLANFKLTRLIFTPQNIEQGMDVVRAMGPHLQELDVQFDGPDPAMTPAQFWQKYDAGEFAKR